MPTKARLGAQLKRASPATTPAPRAAHRLSAPRLELPVSAPGRSRKRKSTRTECNPNSATTTAMEPMRPEVPYQTARGAVPKINAPKLAQDHP